MTKENLISINKLSKRYASGFLALENINLTIKRGEIFALLGPNGAGKTTLINLICGIINPTEGEVLVFGDDIIKNYRATRSMIGLVPQELSTDMFEKVIDTVKFSRSLFGKKNNNSFIEKILKDLSLWDKREQKILTLSGGMKRRVMMAKALSHEPEVLFLDEPTAGVDVELRRDMWQMVKNMRDRGVTIILTTHYIEEAEEMADRVGVIDKGKLLIVEEKKELIKKLGKKELRIRLHTPLLKVPPELSTFNLRISKDNCELILTYNSKSDESGVDTFFRNLEKLQIKYLDIETKESSLEEIFVQLIRNN